jgi:imidazolonepropionase-like amidohydrolase
VWSQPDSIDARNDVNELTDPNTAQVWAENSVWPQDPGFDLAREAGVTTLMLLPGSGNLFGGRTVTVRNVPAITAQAMKFPGAPQGLKIACGENPMRTYGGRGRSPSTRMGNVAGYRRAWIDAADYVRRWDSWRRGNRAGDPPRRDPQLDTLAGVLRGEILVQNHCYRADEMAIMIDVAREFGFRIRTFHHATEAYKIAPLLAREGICVATWTNWWGYKMEVFDAIEENAAMVHAAGGCAIIHSDDAVLVQHLNQEAAAALSAGRRAGLEISEGQAIRWITANPARALGIEAETGTLEPGKRADVVLWSADPFSIYALADRVWIDGVEMFARDRPASRHRSDFLLGQPGQDARP